MPCVALVDEDPLSRRLLGRWLESAGYEVLELASAAELLSRPVLPDICCVSLTLPDLGGDALIGALRAREPASPALLLSSLPATDASARALGCGAYDTLTKPLCREQVVLRVRRAAEAWQLQSRVRAVCGAADLPPALWGRSPTVKGLLATVDSKIHEETPVLMVGESGTGRSAAARLVHSRGPRAGMPFVAFSCAAVPPSRHFDELFGDDSDTVESLFVRAGDGVLFIRDVGWLAAEAQQALVELLSAAAPPMSSKRPSGAWAAAARVDYGAVALERPAVPRLICSSTVGLEALARTGQLCQRLATLLAAPPVLLPALRERSGDVAELVAYWVRRLSLDTGKSPPRVSAAALEALLGYSWPGNVRELSQVVQRALLACDGSSIGVADLPVAVRQGWSESERESDLFEPGQCDDVVPLRELERRAIAHALRAADGNVGHAARLLGIGRATLYRRLAEQGSSKAS